MQYLCLFTYCCVQWGSKYYGVKWNVLGTTEFFIIAAVPPESDRSESSPIINVLTWNLKPYLRPRCILPLCSPRCCSVLHEYRQKCQVVRWLSGVIFPVTWLSLNIDLLSCVSRLLFSVQSCRNVTTQNRMQKPVGLKVSTIVFLHRTREDCEQCPSNIM